MSMRYDELFEAAANVLRRDWAGARAGMAADLRYYYTAVGQAWHDHRLDDLLFLRYMNQMLACTGDRHLRFSMLPTADYRPWGPGFLTRRYENALYVTALRCETRLEPGDRITKINGGTPAEHRAAIQKNFFFSDDPEREDWNGFLKMADTVTVEHAFGGEETIGLKRWPLHPVPAVPRVYDLAEGLILDLRNVPDLPEEKIDELLPLLCREDTPRRELIDGAVYVNWTRRNCAVRAEALRGVPGGEDYLAELEAKADAGYVLEEDEDDRVIPGRGPARRVVLTDTWTRDGAELLALAAKRAGAFLLGRKTLGTIDLWGDLTCDLDGRFTLTWPTAISRAAFEGHPLGPVEPDEAVPWTPEECLGDPLMARAMAYLKEKQ